MTTCHLNHLVGHRPQPRHLPLSLIGADYLGVPFFERLPLLVSFIFGSLSPSVTPSLQLIGAGVGGV